MILEIIVGTCPGSLPSNFIHMEAVKLDPRLKFGEVGIFIPSVLPSGKN
jgi:hypothetical protein